MDITDYDSSPSSVCPNCGNWIGVCNCPREKKQQEHKGHGLECQYCGTPTIYKFGDHYECINPRHPKHPGSTSQFITDNTKTWNDK